MSATEAVMATIPPCDIDAAHGDAVYDGKTTYGPWAYMCQDCFDRYGVGVGLGRGQRLVRASEPPNPADSIAQHAQDVIDRAVSEGRLPG